MSFFLLTLMERKTSFFICTFIFLVVVVFSVLLYISEDQSEQFTSERGIAHYKGNHIKIDNVEVKDTWPLKVNIKLGVAYKTEDGSQKTEVSRNYKLETNKWLI